MNNCSQSEELIVYIAIYTYMCPCVCVPGGGCFLFMSNVEFSDLVTVEKNV